MIGKKRSLWHFAIVVVAIPTLVSPTLARRAATVVQVDGGRVQGIAGGEALAFKGIPYAAPPVGALRWRSPQPVVSWANIRRATDFGPDCMQVTLAKARLNDAKPRTPSEDCLYLNVFTPSTGGSGLPVVVQIDAGGWTFSSTAGLNTEGSFPRNGVIYVSATARMGRFGFFGHPALTAAHEGPLGNYGIQDGIAVLRWVQRNIRAFGGDPRRVTMIGCSGSGAIIEYIMMSPQARGLLSRAIISSAAGRFDLDGSEPLRSLSETRRGLVSADDTGVNFARTMGIEGTGPEALAKLRALPASAVLGDLSILNAWGPGAKYLQPPITYTGGPVIDGETVPRPPEEAMLDTPSPVVPMMIGTTSADVAIVGGTNPSDVFSQYGLPPEKAAKLYNMPLTMPGNSQAVASIMEEPSILFGTNSFRDIAYAVSRESWIIEPARYYAATASKNGKSAWLYRFGYVPSSRRSVLKGAPHGSDMAFLYGRVGAALRSRMTQSDKAAEKLMNKYAINFIKSGNPNGKDLPSWHSFDSGQRVLQVGYTGSVASGSDPLKARLDLVEQASEAAALVGKRLPILPIPQQ